MSITSTSGAPGSVSDISTLYGLSSSAPATTLLDGDSGGASSASSSSSVSQRGKILGQLQQLAQSDPAKFKSVMTDIASALTSQAQQDGGSQADALNGLAAKFQQAAQTDSLSPLQPAHHHHHHASGGAATPASTASAAYQQNGAQGSSSTAGLGAQVGSIISQVLSQDLGAGSPAA